MSVVIETTLGDITVDLYLNQRPVTCLNFLKLCKMKYYNFCLFHSIRSGFIAQTGDPSGEGTGGQSIFGLLEGPEKRFFSGEKMPKIRHTDAGLLSMVCSNDMMVGSQFFFTLASDLDSLDGVHCVIGEVTEGQEVLRQLNEVICDETHRPYRDVRITHTVVLDDPYADPLGLRAPSRSPSPSAERLKGGRIAPDEELDETIGKSAAEIQELIEEREAKARATILEIVGDLPDADIAPPENVLFVCKLNPVTTDEDLEIIFSRFGKIVSCEVIRDKKTNDSLQYAFIEFDDKKSCEEAYFKMDNVLIDDRRIHVDFSQSVSKIKWLGKGRGVKHINEDDNDKGKWSKNDRGLDKEVDRNRRDRPREKDRLHNRIEEYRSKREDSRHMRERSRSRTRLQKNRDDPKRDNRQRQTSRSRSRDRQSRREQRRSRSRERLSNNNYEREHSRKDRKDYKELNSDQSHEINRDRKDSFVEETSKRHKLDDKDNYKFNKNNHRKRSASRSRAEVDNSRQSRRQKSASPDRNDVSLEMNKDKKYRKIHNGNGDSDRIIAKSSNKEDKDSNIKNYKVSKTDKSIKRHASIDRNGDNDSSSKRNRKDKSEKVDSTKNKQAKLSKDKKNKTPSNVNKKEKVKTKKKVKKQRKDSTSTDSSSESSSSSSDSSSSGIDKRKKTLKRKKKKYETSSSSSSSSSSSDTTSSSSSSSDSSTNSSSSDSIRKSKKKNKKVVMKKNKKTSKKK